MSKIKTFSIFLVLIKTIMMIVKIDQLLFKCFCIQQTSEINGIAMGY